MRQIFAPSIVPEGSSQVVYLVLDDFGKMGRVWREADADKTDLETVVSDLISGQYNNPIKVIALDPTNHWSDDVSTVVAREIRRRFDLKGEDVAGSIASFVDDYDRWDRQLTLRLV